MFVSDDAGDPATDGFMQRVGQGRRMSQRAGRGVSRRGFVRGTGAVVGAGVATAPAVAQETQPDFGGYTDGAKGGTYEDLRGESAVTVEVGGGSEELAFLPTNLWIDTGTTVTFEWSSSGHNVLFDGTPEAAEVSGHEPLEDSGFSFDVTFDAGGIYTYFCRPHESLGMLGAIAVGEEVPTVSVGGGDGGPTGPVVPDAAKTIGVASFIAMVSTLGLAYFFMRYGGDYETPE